MTNPAPRPALRKAEDAQIHPAAPRPTRSPRAARTPVPAIEAPTPAPAPVPAPTPTAAAAVAAPKPKSRKTETTPRKRKFSGSTSDHMRIPEMTTEMNEAASGSHHRSKKPRRPAHDTFFGAAPEPSSDLEVEAEIETVLAPRKAEKDEPQGKAAKAPNLMSGKAVELDVHVPKELRKAAKATAKARGLDLDTVVIDLLHAWVTDQD